MNILSLFGGIECGKVAIDRAGIKVDKYYSSEVDKHAIKVSAKNHPDIIHLGDVTKWREWDINWQSIDMLIGGSPCQGFSIAGKQLNFEDPRSKLFFVYAQILEHIKTVNHKVIFLLENVRMKKECLDVISNRLGIEPIMIDSNLVSAQNRKRFYWTNIKGITQPQDKGIMLNSILETQVPDKFYITTERCIEICNIEATKGKICYIGSNSQGNRVYSIHGKSVTLSALSALGGGWGANTGLYWIPTITPDRVNKRQNGQRFKPSNSKFYTLTAQDKHGILINGQIRKLMPVECERLQNLPDGYTELEGISDNIRIKMLGNGWTVDVIVHLLSFINKEGN